MSKMNLYMGKSIQDLKALYGIPDLKKRKIKMLCNTATSIFNQANDARKLGDEEQSYVKFMKYLNIITVIRSSDEYNKDKTYYNTLLSISNVKKAIELAEELSKSLRERYDQLSEQETILKKHDDFEEQEKVKKKITQDIERAKNIRVKEAEKPQQQQKYTISCSELYSLMQSEDQSFLVIDTRPEHYYAKSKMKTPHCCNIPEEKIIQGSSASKLGQMLSNGSKLQWERRGSVNHIILVDWGNGVFALGSTLYTLFDIMVKWDPHVEYKNTPVVLSGGYTDWLLTYPMLCTDSSQQPPPQNAELDVLLDDIVYPAFDIASVSETTSKSNGSVKNLSEVPGVDRNSKAAALQTYDERSQKVTQILGKQEKLVDNAILLEKKRLDAEQRWEKISLIREKEAEEEKRILLQQREKELLYSMMQLEISQKDKLMENEMLREQLEEYKRREREENAVRSDRTLSEIEARELERVAAKRIEDKEKERVKLDKQRAQLAQEREKKLAEARAKKKELIAKHPEKVEYIELNDEPNEASSSLKRSHSSPNIAQAADNVDKTVKHRVAPHFDRTVKPVSREHDYECNDSYERDFGSAGGALGKGLTGLKNLGNTCYMNSIVQCLNNTNFLLQYFCEGTYREHVNHNNKTKGKIAEEVAAVVQALWSGQYRSIASKDLRTIVGVHQKRFRGVEQQDSHEFLTILMDWLHLDLQTTIRPSIDKLNENIPPSEKAWQEYTKSKESLILRLFYGQIKSTVACLVCGEESATYESFSNLSLELPTSSIRCTLRDCLNLYLKEEKVSGWHCPACKDKRDARKKLDISKLPPVLVIHFKRFYVDNYITNSCHKKDTYIDFPMQGLNMTPYVVQESQNIGGGASYNLYGVSNHYGSMESGHYTAYCKSSIYGKWYKYDDHNVTPMDPSDVNSSAAYILFYTTLSDKGT